MIIWLDDERDPSSGKWRPLLSGFLCREMTRTEIHQAVLWVKDVAGFKAAFRIAILSGTLPEAVFFDNDLGTPEQGIDAFRWMEERVREKNLGRFRIFCQSANPAAKHHILGGVQSLERFWRSSEKSS